MKKNIIILIIFLTTYLSYAQSNSVKIIEINEERIVRMNSVNSSLLPKMTKLGAGENGTETFTAFQLKYQGKSGFFILSKNVMIIRFDYVFPNEYIQKSNLNNLNQKLNYGKIYFNEESKTYTYEYKYWLGTEKMTQDQYTSFWAYLDLDLKLLP
jgi:hypothetical protein